MSLSAHAELGALYEVRRFGGAVAVRAPDVPARWLNRVLGEPDDLDAVRAFYGDVPHMISCATQPEGYLPGYAYMQFERPVGQGARPPDPPLRIEQVGPAGGLDFARPVGTAFGIPEGPLRFLPGRPGWTCLVAYDGDEAIAAGAMFDGYLTLGGTLPHARGRGAQSAILAERIAIAGRMGLTRVTTETGVDGGPSYRNILAAGFTEAGVIPNWESPTD